MSVDPTPSSTVCVLRDGEDGPEVLMVRRSRTMDFMGGTWVFPGGRIDAVDHEEVATTAVGGHDPWRAAAVRELAEEVGVWITNPDVPAATAAGWSHLRGEEVFVAVNGSGRRFDGGRLELISNWITPEGLPRRYDTRFFVVGVDPSVSGVADGSEIVECMWTTPEAALVRGASGAWGVPFPTRKHLHLFTEFPSVEAIVAHAAATTVVPILPRVTATPDGGPGLTMPGSDEVEPV